MEGVVEKLQRIGLTEYEAKAYLTLLRDHLNSASKLSEKSGVPRTKIYSVLESLERKGWIRIFLGYRSCSELLNRGRFSRRSKRITRSSWGPSRRRSRRR